MNNFGLSEKIKEAILAILCKHSLVKKAVIFGSRAKNTHKTNSDIDLAVWLCPDSAIHAEAISSYHELNRLRADFDESNIPYFFDIVDYQRITNDKLRQAIDMNGKDFYLRDRDM